MKKSEVQTHSDRPYGSQYPAVNVKIYQWGPGDASVVTRFKCPEKQAEKALEYAFNSAQWHFWKGAEEYATEVFGKGVKVYGAGRSSGWLIVVGLSDVETWDAIQLGKWAKFVGIIREEIKGLGDADVILEDIDANQWYKEGAEEYNFVDTKAGTKCIADLKSEAVVAGFGPVLREPVPA